VYWRDYWRECYMKLFISLLDTKENNNDFSNELTMQNCFSLSELVKKIRIVFFLGFFLSMLIGCDPAIQYRKLVKNQLNSGITNDTLFHGVYFGMTYDEYYNHITALGHQGKVSQGGDMSVQCEIDEFDTKIRMNFVPEYINDSIQVMRVTYSYVSWAPWNKRTTDDLLWKDVINLYRNKYGPNFIQFKSNQSARPALVWVLGNQRITLFQKDEAKVNARFTNLRKTNS